MILPFTTGQWNALRFVALFFVCVPLVEKALHKLHQLKTAKRILMGKPARIRASRLGNWGLHQEVDELSWRSKIMALIVTVFYVSISLYTEFASGSAQVKITSIGIAPASRKTAVEGKPALYDSNFMAVTGYSACTSNASRMAIQRLWEDMASHEAHVIKYATSLKQWLQTAHQLPVAAQIRDKSWRKTDFISDNGTHLILLVTSKVNGILPSATMDNEKVCLPNGVDSLVCFSNREIISLLALIGNARYFEDGLIHLPLVKGKKFLLSNDAFEVESINEEDRQARVSLASALTRQGFWEAKNRTGLMSFQFRFKYAASVKGAICDEKPKIQPPFLKIGEDTDIFIRTLKTPWTKPWFPSNASAACIGLFMNRISVFWEIGNSSMVCYHAPYSFYFLADMFCASRNEDGTLILSKTVQITKTPRNSTSDVPQDTDVHDGRSQRARMRVFWTLSWRGQELELADVARGAFVSFAISRNLYGFSRALEELFSINVQRAEAESIASLLRRGVPRLRHVGVRNVQYEIIRTEERATIASWIFFFWVIASLLAVCFLWSIKAMRLRLLPDVDFLYRRAVMQQYSMHNTGKAILHPPTVRLRTAGAHAMLTFSYGDTVTDTSNAEDQTM